MSRITKVCQLPCPHHRIARVNYQGEWLWIGSRQQEASSLHVALIQCGDPAVQ